MWKLLRRTILPNNTGVGAPFVATQVWYDTATRRPFTQQQDSQANDPSELAKDAEVERYEYLPGRTRVVYYNGNGSVYTKNLAVSAGPFSPTLKIKVTPSVGVTDASRKDACLDLTGQYGFPPYQIEVVGEPGPAQGYYQAAVSTLEIYPVRFYNLGVGTYTLRVRDATGDGRTQTLQIGVASFGYPIGTPLSDFIIADRLYRRWWLRNELRAELRNYSASQGNGNFVLPYGTLVDGYLLPGSNGTIWRQVYADGNTTDFQADVYFVDTSTARSSSLQLDNLILFHPDTTAEQNGGAIVETLGGVAPLLFTLSGPAGSVSNATGHFERLPGGAYEFVVTDALGTRLTASFLLEDRYRLWRYLNYDDLDSAPMRVEFWRRDYDGPAATVYLTDEPVTIKSDGLSGDLGGQGDLPSVVGTSAEVNVLAEPNLFEPIELGDDRNCRVDYYYRGKLTFRGYVRPQISTQLLLSGLQHIGLTATDGLAALKGEDFRGHIGQRLGGHRPVLNTILHCLSRCQISLPIQVYTNRRDATMSTMDAPEQAATTNRTGYYDEEKKDVENQRVVLDADAQLLGGALVQREGTWQIRSAHEAALDAAGRSYLAAGTPLANVTAVSPSGAILPPGDNRWHWVDANQEKQIRPGWKSLIGTTDAGYLDNAFWQGEVFNDTYAWLDDYSKLRGANGWYPPVGTTFPLILQRIGEKGKDHSTLWPRSTGLSIRDDRYLISPPLPLAAGLEAVPAFLRVTGKLVPSVYYLDYDNNQVPSPTTAAKAYLPYDVVIDGHSTGVRLVEIARVDGATAKDATAEVALPPMPSGAQTAVLRVYTWQAPDSNLFRDAQAYSPLQAYKKGDVVRDDYASGQNLFVARRDQPAYFFNQIPTVFLPADEWAPIAAVNTADGQLLITSIGIQLRPQNATWDGEDNFRADGPGGTVRPTEPLKSYHVDVPIDAGLYTGNLSAFGKGVGSVEDTMTTSWSRNVDEAASPLLEANTFDQLALRANNARLLVGTLRNKGIPPPYLLDSVDTPYDVPGRRFLVGSASWRTRAAETEVSLIEIGAGSDAVYQPVSAGRILPQGDISPTGKFIPHRRVLPGGGRRVVAG